MCSYFTSLDGKTDIFENFTLKTICHTTKLTKLRGEQLDITATLSFHLKSRSFSYHFTFCDYNILRYNKCKLFCESDKLLKEPKLTLCDLSRMARELPL